MDTEKKEKNVDILKNSEVGRELSRAKNTLRLRISVQLTGGHQWGIHVSLRQDPIFKWIKFSIFKFFNNYLKKFF